MGMDAGGAGGAVGLVDREVRSGSRDGESTKITVARRTYSTAPADLWDALTNAERIPRWFLPISGELEVGGRYRLEGNAGGAIERCEEPEFLAVTWEFGGMVSWLELTLTPTDGGTELQLVHEGAVLEEMWEQFGPGATGVGWDLALLGLGHHVDGGGATLDPAEGAAFPTTPEGRSFVEQVAAAWADAVVADGADGEWAKTSAANAVAFFTTPTEDTSEE